MEILVSFSFCKFVNRVLGSVHELPEKELDQYFPQKVPDLTLASVTFIYIVLGSVAKRRKFRGCYVEQKRRRPIQNISVFLSKSNLVLYRNSRLWLRKREKMFTLIITHVRYIKIQLETKDITTGLYGVNHTNSYIIPPKPLVVMSIVLFWILTYRTWANAADQNANFPSSWGFEFNGLYSDLSVRIHSCYINIIRIDRCQLKIPPRVKLTCNLLPLW